LPGPSEQKNAKPLAKNAKSLQNNAKQAETG